MQKTLNFSKESTLNSEKRPFLAREREKTDNRNSKARISRQKKKIEVTYRDDHAHYDALLEPIGRKEASVGYPEQISTLRATRLGR